MCDRRTEKLTHIPGQILLKKHVNLEKVKILAFFLFSLFSPDPDLKEFFAECKLYQPTIYQLKVESQSQAD